MSGKLAIVFCVHHKPWLMMGTLLTLMSQAHQDADLFFVYNVGDGIIARDSYGEYRRIAASSEENIQLSPFDERVREVCQVRGWKCHEVEYENDHGLDSGCWYKFIRDGRWRDYEYVLFVGEGTLFAHPRVVPSLVAFAERRGAHFVASGHEKRRVPRANMQPRCPPDPSLSAMDAFHFEMMAATFGVFCRAPEFQAVFDRWGSDFVVETEHHVPGVSRGGVLPRRVRAGIQKGWGSPFTHPDAPLAGRLVRSMPPAVDRWASRLRMALGESDDATAASEALAYVGGGYDVRPGVHTREVQKEQGVVFHRVEEPEWFGCATNHLMSREFLERFTSQIDRYGMYDVIDLPFAGSALEVVWGLLPAWLGFDKWFTNGFHRVRKHFPTYQREDYPPEMASYINRYHTGRLVVGWETDFLKLETWRRSDLGDLRQVLPAIYF